MPINDIDVAALVLPTAALAKVHTAAQSRNVAHRGHSSDVGDQQRIRRAGWLTTATTKQRARTCRSCWWCYWWCVL
jgi:hypothetical protein